MSKQVGSGHIAIFPVMKGIRKKIGQEFDAAARESRSRFSRAFGRAGEETGSKVGAGFRAAFGRTDLATPGVQRLKSEVASASRALSKARLAQQDAAGKVRTAEARLAAAQTASANAAAGLARAETNAAAARSKYGVNSAKAQAAERQLETARTKVARTAAAVTSAEEQLASAKRRAATAGETLTAASQRLASAQSALAASAMRAQSQVASFGQRTLASFKSGWSGALGPATSAFQGFAQSAGRHLGSIAKAASPVASRIVAPFRSAFTAVGSAISTTIGPSLRSATSAISTTVGPALRAVVSRAASTGKAIVSHVGGAFKAIGQSALVAAGIIAGAFAKSLSSAISRVDTLNNFPKVMKNLGYSTEDATRSIEKLSNGIQGLPTRLDDIASTTQRLAPLASSLDEASDLAIALNNAFLAGGKGSAEAARGMEQYTQMLAVGKVDMMAWRTLQETMPGQLNQIAQALLGTTANSQDLYQAMQNGTISFEDFNAAILSLNEHGINGFASLKDQAFDATAGIQTAFENVKTALSKGGASIIQAIGPENITAAAAKVQAAIGQISNSIAALIEKFKGMNFTGDLSKQLSALGPIAAGALAPLLSKLPLVGRLFTGLTGPIGLTIGIIGGLLASSEPLRESLGNLAMSVGDSLMDAFEKLEPTLTQVGGALSDLMGTVGDALAPVIEAMIPIVEELITIFADAAADILPSVVPVLESLGDAFSVIADVITGTVIPIIEGLLPAVEAVLGALIGIVEPGLDTLKAIIDTVTAIISGDWEAAWEGIKGIFTGVWDTIKATVSAAIEIIKTTISAALTVISTLWSETWDRIKSLASTVWDGIKSTISSAVDAVKSAISEKLEAIKNAWTTGWSAVKDFASSAWDGIRSKASEGITTVATAVSSGMSTVKAGWTSAWNTVRNTVSNAWSGIKAGASNGLSSVVSTMRSLPGRVLGALGNLGSLLVSSGRSLISGFTSGITGAFSRAINAVKNGLSKIRSFFPFSPAKRGPFSGRGWVKYSGQSIPPALADGIRTKLPTAMAAARDLARATSDALAVEADSPAVGMTGGVAGGSMTSNVPAPAGVVFNIGGIYNPQPEASSTTLSRELARVAAGVDVLV